MAIFHMNIQVISRGKGKSAVAAAAYRAAEKINNEYDGRVRNYTRKLGVVHKEIMLPQNAPADFSDRSVLWNSVEQIDRNSNAQLAREIEFALPVELSMEQNILLAQEYVKNHFTDKGMIADMCIHDKQDGNPHCHVMLSLRPLNENGTWGAKSRKEYIFNQSGERIKLPSGEWKSRKVNAVDWNEQTKAEEWRKGWADTLNKYLEQNGITERVDHRSFERQGNGLTPTIHLGYVAHRMEQRGIRTERGDYNRQVTALNNEIKQTKARIRKAKDWLYKHPIHNPPSIVDIMGGVGKGREIKTNWQAIRNLQTQAKVLMFLQNNKIRSIDDFSDTVVRIHNRLGAVTDNIKKAERRLETLATHFTHYDNINAHRTTIQKYKKLKPKKDEEAFNSLNPFTRNRAAKDYENATKKHEAYYDKHEEAITAYEAAQAYFAGVMNGRKDLPIKDWQKEQKELLAKRYAMCDEYYSLKEKVPAVEAIQHSVENLMREDLQSQRTQPTRAQGMVL